MAAESDELNEGTELALVAGDALGNSTNTVDIPVTKIIPAVKGCLSQLDFIDYEAAGTAHLVTPMTVIGDVSPTLTVDVPVNGTAFNYSGVVSDSAGNVPAAGDWFVIKHWETKLFYRFYINTWSAGVFNIKTTNLWGDANGTGSPVAFPSGSKIWFMGAPDQDHNTRRIYMKASTVRQIPVRVTSLKKNQPILLHSDNITAAALVFQIGISHPTPK